MTEAVQAHLSNARDEGTLTTGTTRVVRMLVYMLDKVDIGPLLMHSTLIHVLSHAHHALTPAHTHKAKHDANTALDKRMLSHCMHMYSHVLQSILMTW